MCVVFWDENEISRDYIPCRLRLNAARFKRVVVVRTVFIIIILYVGKWCVKEGKQKNNTCTLTHTHTHKHADVWERVTKLYVNPERATNPFRTTV